MRHRYSSVALVVLSLIGVRTSGVSVAPAQTPADLFDTGVLQELRLSINSTNLTQLRASLGDVDFPADVQWGGSRVRNAAVRSRGSAASNPNRIGLLVDFNRYRTSQQSIGLGSLVLDNLEQDPSMIRAHVAMAFIARMGQPASRSFFCRLYINNIYQGVYGVIENIDRDFLARSLGQNNGYLFQYHRVTSFHGTFPGEDLAAYKVLFEPRTRTLEPDASLYAPIRSLFREANGPGDAVWRQRVEKYIDLRQLMTYVAIEAFLSESDGFTGSRGMNNFFVYRPGGTTTHQILPGDRSGAMVQVDSSIFLHNDENVLFRRAYAFGDLRAVYLDVLDECVKMATEDNWLQAEVARSAAVVAQAAREATSRPFSSVEVNAATKVVAEFARLRPAFVRQEVQKARAASGTTPGAQPSGVVLNDGPGADKGAATTASRDPRSRDRGSREVTGVAVARQNPGSIPPIGGTPSGLPLLQKGNLTYVGAFRLPESGPSPRTFDYGGQGLAYLTANNSLLVAGADIYGLAAEVGIPAPGTGALSDLPRAALRQPLTDVLDGKRLTVDGDKSNGAYIGGLFPAPPYLLVSVYDFYDGSGNQSKSHFRTSLNFGEISGRVIGPVQVGDSQAGFVSGYMTPIPTAWQGVLGGSALTGNCCLSIISRTSLGPSVSVFNPADVGAVTPVPATQVLGYPLNHPTIGAYAPPGELFNGAVTMGGVVFPAGTSSVLFFGRKPTNKANYCYGEGTLDSRLDRQPVPGTGGQVVYCYDPTSPYKGTHGFPYTFFVWAYDANDLVAVKQGKKQPWDPVPYATWSFDLPFQTSSGYGGGRQIKGVAYDPAAQRIYLTAEGQDGCCTPLVHVFAISGSVTSRQ